MVRTKTEGSFYVDGKNHNKMQSLGTYTFCKAYAMICFTKGIYKQNTANRDVKVALVCGQQLHNKHVAWNHEPRPVTFMIKTVMSKNLTQDNE